MPQTNNPYQNNAQSNNNNYQMNAMSQQFGNININQMPFHLTPQQYTEYYYQQMNNIGNNNNMNNMYQNNRNQNNNFGQQNNNFFQSQPQTNFGQPQAQNNNGFNQMNQYQPPQMSVPQNQCEQNNGYNNGIYANSQQNTNMLSPIATNYNQSSHMAQHNSPISPNVVTSPHSMNSPISMHNGHNTHQSGFARAKLPFRNWHSDIPRSQTVPTPTNQPPKQTYDDSMTHSQYNNANMLSPQSKSNDFFVHNQRQQNLQHKNWLNQSPQPSQFPSPPRRNVIGSGIPNTANNQQQTEQVAIDGSLPGAPTVGYIAEPELNFQMSSAADFPLSPGSVLKK